MLEEYGPFSLTKALVHADRLQAIACGTQPAPVTVEIDLADGFCNQACPHCFFDSPSAGSPTFFPPERAESLARELKEAGVKAIEFPGGGEPTTHPQFSQVISSFSLAGLPMGLVTNGLLHGRVLECRSKFQWIRISLDAASGATYRKTHGSDSFESVVNGVMSIVEADDGPMIGLGYLLTPANVHEISAAVSLAEELKVDYIQFRPASKVSWQGVNLDDVLNELRSQASRAPLSIYYSEHKWKRLLHGRLSQTCSTSVLVGIVKANGDMPFCCLKRSENLIRGNVVADSFRAVWWSDAAPEFLDVSTAKCPLPCKHDSYNDAFEALRSDLLCSNFL